MPSIRDSDLPRQSNSIDFVAFLLALMKGFYAKFSLSYTGGIDSS